MATRPPRRSAASRPVKRAAAAAPAKAKNKPKSKAKPAARPQAARPPARKSPARAPRPVPAPALAPAPLFPETKTVITPGTLLAPVPAVMVTCARPGERPNIITIAWAGTVNSNPPMLSISVRPERYSHAILKETGEFVVNLPTTAMVETTDWCGMVSGRKEDKFARRGLTAKPGLMVGAPVIAECPVNIECRVRDTLDLGSHTMFLAEVMAVQVAERLFDPTGYLRLQDAELVAFAHGQYHALGPALGKMGASVARRKKVGARQA